MCAKYHRVLSAASIEENAATEVGYPAVYAAVEMDDPPNETTFTYPASRKTQCWVAVGVVAKDKSQVHFRPDDLMYNMRFNV